MLAVSIFDGMLRAFVTKERAPLMLSPEERGCAFFKTLRLFLLKTQQRSVDPVQTAIIESMRSTDPLVFPITPKLMSQYKEITVEDVRSNLRWETTMIITMLNIVRHEINRLRTLRFALITGQPIIMWRNPFCGKQAAGLCVEEKEMLYSSHQALTSKFVVRLRSACQDNINPRKGLSNGTGVELHSLTLDPREDLKQLLKRLEKAEPAEEIALLYPPISVNVELLNPDLSKFGPGDTLVPGRAVIPVFQRSRSRYEPIKSWELLNRINPIDGVRYRPHGVEPEFACTFEKAQSKTLDSVIIDLNRWPGMNLSFEKVNVALTRVKTREDLRLMPVLPGQSLDHLYCLRPDPRMQVWRAGFGPDGNWSPELCKSAIDRLPPDFFKTKKQSSSYRKTKSRQGNDDSTGKRKYGKSPSTDVGEKDAATLKKGKDSGDKSRGGKDLAKAPAATAIFKLDLPIPGIRKKSFKAFHVTPDGDCLFHSVKRLLDLQLAVQHMRAQVVNYMDGLPPVEQMTIVNEHLLREPSWQNERILVPQGILDDDGEEVLGDILLDASSLSDVHGDRFQRLWRLYKHDMSGKTWAGNAEMAALKTLYSV